MVVNMVNPLACSKNVLDVSNIDVDIDDHSISPLDIDGQEIALFLIPKSDTF